MLKSWAVPRGLTEKSGERRLAIAVEEHALEYIGFKGTIQQGENGAGEVKSWDDRTCVPLIWDDDRIEVALQGRELAGKHNLIRFQKGGEKAWLIVKSRAILSWLIFKQTVLPLPSAYPSVAGVTRSPP